MNVNIWNTLSRTFTVGRVDFEWSDLCFMQAPQMVINNLKLSYRRFGYSTRQLPLWFLLKKNLLS